MHSLFSFMKISYAALSNKINEHSGLVRVLNYLDKAITYITVFLYIGLLCYEFFYCDILGATLLYRSILIPAVSFIVVSLFRKFISSPRPYEVYDFTPALKKDTVGCSFPSRHVFSIFMIAMTYFQLSIIMGIIVVIMGIFLAIIRVVGGAHFIKDVIAGMLIAVISGLLCYNFLGGVLGLFVLTF